MIRITRRVGQPFLLQLRQVFFPLIWMFQRGRYLAVWTTVRYNFFCKLYGSCGFGENPFSVHFRWSKGFYLNYLKKKNLGNQLYPWDFLSLELNFSLLSKLIGDRPPIFAQTPTFGLKIACLFARMLPTKRIGSTADHPTDQECTGQPF